MKDSKTQKTFENIRTEMSKFTPKQREELHEKALKYIYPEGFKICDNKHIRIFVGKEEECPMCE
jgi:regulator of replication initiation timing